MGVCKKVDRIKHLQRILGFLKKHRLAASGIPCFAMRNLCFASACKGAYLGVCNRSACEVIKDLSRKTSEAVQGEAAAGFFSKAESTSEIK